MIWLRDSPSSSNMPSFSWLHALDQSEVDWHRRSHTFPFPSIPVSRRMCACHTVSACLYHLPGTGHCSSGVDFSWLAGGASMPRHLHYKAMHRVITQRIMSQAPSWEVAEDKKFYYCSQDRKGYGCDCWLDVHVVHMLVTLFHSYHIWRHIDFAICEVSGRWSAGFDIISLITQ